MRAVVSRVSEAAVLVEGEVVGELAGPGLLVLLGVTHDDGPGEADTMARKLSELRILRDERSISDSGAGVLIEKCRTKAVPVPKMEDIGRSPFRAELESEWSNMLAHQLPTLPPFDHFWTELPKVFAWLEERVPKEALAPVRLGAEEILETIILPRDHKTLIY